MVNDYRQKSLISRIIHKFHEFIRDIRGQIREYSRCQKQEKRLQKDLK